jgi:putative phosphoesterase
MRAPTRIGIISDTHGLLRPQALRELAGSQLIIHAGDVGAPEILDRLREIAPVVAVRGNVDQGDWATKLPLTAVAEAGEHRFYVLHDVKQLDLNPSAAGFQFVVSGHTHKFVHIDRNGVSFINPGSAGPRRFQLAVTVARLDFNFRPPKVKFVELAV